MLSGSATSAWVRERTLHRVATTFKGGDNDQETTNHKKKVEGEENKENED